MKDVLDLFGDLPDYPGKRAPKNRPTSGKPTRDTAEDRYNGAKGKEYVINGEKLIFYTIGEVCVRHWAKALLHYGCGKARVGFPNPVFAPHPRMVNRCQERQSRDAGFTASHNLTRYWMLWNNSV